MKVLVTGGAGFVGSHLSERLVEMSYEVVILDNLSTGNLKNLDKIRNDVEFIEEDILNSQLVNKLVNSVDVVFHLAAAVGVRTIINHPISSLMTNYNGSENVLLAAAKSTTRIFIASTSEIYGKNPNQPLRETDDRVVGAPQKLRWSYADAKALEESLAFALHLEQRLPVTTIRFFNTVGPKQTGQYGMVIPRFIQAALNNESLEIYGDGTQTRVFCHIHDVIDALTMLLAEPKAVGNTFNLGGNGEISIINLAKKIIEITNSKSILKFLDYNEVFPPQFEDMQRRVPDISKLQSIIEWSPKRNLDKIIQDIITFEKRNH